MAIKRKRFFRDAFNELTAGNIDVKEKWCFAPFFVNRLMKAYRVNKFGKQKRTPSPEPARLTNEEKWKLFFRHLSFYKSMPVSPDWVALFNYCVSKGRIIEVPPIEVFSSKAYKLAEKDVKTFVMANWSELITDVNKYKAGDHRLPIQ